MAQVDSVKPDLRVLHHIHNLPPGSTARQALYMKRSKARDKQPVRTNSRSSSPDQSRGLPKIPPLLLEDDPVAPLPLASEPISETPGSHPVEVSEPCGAAKLSLMVRDPHSLYAHWKLTPAQTSEPLVLHLHGENAGGPLAAQIRIGPESNHAFIPVATAGQQYVAEIGHLDQSGGWVTIATSAPVTTPHDTISEDTSAQFAEMPAALPRHVSALWNVPANPSLPEEDLESNNRSLAGLSAPPSVSWIPSLGQLGSREKTSEAGFALEMSDQPDLTTWMPVAGSSTKEVIGTVDFKHFALGSSVETKAESSFLEDASPTLPGLFLQVGTELVVYGATQPGAIVTMAGNPIDLKPDGTFSCRFALPNGDFEMTIEAISIEGNLRRAGLKVRRTTYAP